MSLNLPTLAPRTLGRTARPVAPVIWRIGPDSSPSADVMQRLPEIGAAWFFIDADAPDDLLHQLGQLTPAMSAVIGMSQTHLTPRAAHWLTGRLARLGLSSCDGVMIQDVSPSEIKAGGPFHRLIQLRDRGLTKTFWIDAEDAPSAEWMVENTPAHALCIPFSLVDQTAAYRILPATAEMGLALIARPGDASEKNLAFISAEPRISSILIDLPPTPPEFTRIINAIAHPLPESQRLEAWERYRAAHLEPPKPKRNLPPDMI